MIRAVHKRIDLLVNLQLQSKFDEYNRQLAVLDTRLSSISDLAKHLGTEGTAWAWLHWASEVGCEIHDGPKGKYAKFPPLPPKEERERIKRSRYPPSRIWTPDKSHGTWY